ncbi:MAG TPA: A/G-specific adenine glycosylase [Myxococcota bacterium]|nr:A/G-specific adenine glycosylase [Myxococcota bacterium]
MSARAAALAEARSALLPWYRANRRDLPWRRTRDPYAIWVSEAMLQQTRVETVIPYYERFLQRFPDIATLAGASLEDVYAAWAGLGYYSRARNLHRAALTLLERFDGRLPTTRDELLELPGIGRYTAGAVASIAFERPEPVLDGNVERVLARYLGVREDVGGPSGAAALWDAAEHLVIGPEPGELNQALMELGATLCSARAPRCLACPLRAGCIARRDGDADSLPRKSARAKPRAMRAVAVLVRRGPRVLAVRRPPGGLLGGLWELPGGAVKRGEAPKDALRRAIREQTGLELAQVEAAGSVEHTFTHRQLRLQLFRGDGGRGRLRLRELEAYRWLTPAAFRGLAQGALTRKALDRVLGPALGPTGLGKAPSAVQAAPAR